MDDPPNQVMHFCTTPDGVRLAYAVSGQGPALVKTATWMSHLEFDSRSPVWTPWLTALSRHNRLIRYDARGCGLSDRDVGAFSLEAWVSDLETVVDAAGLDERFDLLGMSQGGPVAVAFAARHPERVRRLVLYGTYARGVLKRGLDRARQEEARALVDVIRLGWGKDNPAFRQLFTSLFLPGGTSEQMAWYNELQRVSTSPATAAAVVEATYVLDVTEVAAQVRAPTLVVHARGDARAPIEEGRLLTALIPNAHFVALDSANHVLLEQEPAWGAFLEALGPFLGLPLTPTASPTHRSDAARAAADLTERERDVVGLLRRGWTNKRIARELDLSPKTVRNYVSTVLSKLGAATRSEVAALAAEAGIGDEAA